MKSISLAITLSHWRLITLCLISGALMAGCGSGSFTSAGASSGGTGVLLASVSGAVADGYLEKATVFLDRNDNYQRDDDEPYDITDSNGTYTLTVDPADVGMHSIVALVTKGVTIDKDTNQPVANSYLLSMPKNSVSGTASSNFISPITSQLREMMETGGYASVQQAADALRTRMGLSAGIDITADYIANKNTSLHTAAQYMATIMGNQMDQVMGSSGSVDKDRYRSMMGTIFNNMSTVMGARSQDDLEELNRTMTTMMSTMPSSTMGQPFGRMSNTAP